ncbi:MAG: flagellar hook-associated protein 3, partial [Pseudobutyrivibrio sp.]|nr:flagellar hook-associated protein 3 [Pseudobutyrivibrio sp.]
MRVTNKMIMNNAASNINSTKEIVNQRNTQMTTQKKIDKPSDDPVIAVRSLRLSTTLSQVTQYYQKNIPDASSWIEVTETSLLNIRDLITDCKTLSDKGANGSLNQEDRNTIITQLESLQKAVFKEGNADYANRTVFTGYRTNSDLVFTKNETETEYQITQTLSIEKNMEEHRYYNGITKVPTTKTEVAATNNINDMAQTNYYRVRLNYDDVLSRDNFVVTGAAGNEITVDITDFANETEWADYQVADGANPGEFLKKQGEKTVPDDSIYFIRETGDIILGNNIAA